MGIIKKIQLDDDHYVEITYDEDPFNPREWGYDSKLCIREHRSYIFPNELDINFEDLNSDDEYSDTETVGQHENKKLEGYYVFWLDCYEHSGISFSLAGQGMQCQFDTARKCGLIAIPKLGYTEEQAKACAKQDIETYNAYLDGEVYSFGLFKTFPSKEIDGRVYKTDDELIDSCSGFYNYESIADNIPKEYRDKFLSSI